MFTTRDGPTAGQGASGRPWDRFNLGDHVGDAAAAVAANRGMLREALAARPVFLKQVHGTGVAALDADTPDGTEADGAISTQRGLACTMMVADCLPVLFTNAAGTAVGAAHAGWRGLAGGILENTVSFLQASIESARMDMPSNRDETDEIMAWLGPCIGPRAFEVGAEVRAAFVENDAGATASFKPLGGGKYLADLPALARRRLAAAGVTRAYGNDGSSAWCTVTQQGRFFSHRRDQPVLGTTGRMAACIWRS